MADHLEAFTRRLDLKEKMNSYADEMANLEFGLKLYADQKEKTKDDMQRFLFQEKIFDITDGLVAKRRLIISAKAQIEACDKETASIMGHINSQSKALRAAAKEMITKGQIEEPQLKALLEAGIYKFNNGKFESDHEKARIFKQMITIVNAVQKKEQENKLVKAI